MIETKCELEKYIKKCGISQRMSKSLVYLSKENDAVNVIYNILNNNEEDFNKFINVFNNALDGYKQKYEKVKNDYETKQFIDKDYNKSISDNYLLKKQYSNLKISYDKLLQEKNVISLSINREIIDLKDKLADYEIEFHRLNKELNYYKDLIEKSNKITDSIGYVYLLKTDIDIGYKIGSTKNIKERKVFQTNVPFKWEFIKKWYCINYKLVEKKLHKIYNHKRCANSEWFDIDEKDIRNIDLFFNENKLLISDEVNI
jgi:hypothetical protein